MLFVFQKRFFLKEICFTNAIFFFFCMFWKNIQLQKYMILLLNRTNSVYSVFLKQSGKILKNFAFVFYEMCISYFFPHKKIRNCKKFARNFLAPSGPPFWKLAVLQAWRHRWEKTKNCEANKNIRGLYSFVFLENFSLFASQTSSIAWKKVSIFSKNFHFFSHFEEFFIFFRAIKKHFLCAARNFFV